MSQMNLLLRTINPVQELYDAFLEMAFQMLGMSEEQKEERAGQILQIILAAGSVSEALSRMAQKGYI